MALTRRTIGLAALVSGVSLLTAMLLYASGAWPKPDVPIVRDPAIVAAPQGAFAGHSKNVWDVAFSPDGKLLATGAADRAVKVWDTVTGKRLYTLGDSTDWVYAVAWSPDGKHLAAGGVDKSIRNWEANAEGGTLTHAAFAHKAAVTKLLFTADSTLRARRRPLLMLKLPSRSGSLISPFQPTVVRGFSK